MFVENKKNNFSYKVTKDKLSYYANIDTRDLLRNFENNLNTGFKTEFVENWQEEYGYNEISTNNEYIWYKKLFESIFNPFNIVLIILTIISFLTQDIMTGITISFLVMVSSMIKYVQENKSNKACEKLKSMIKTTATVKRDGIKKEIDIKDIIEGDIVYLSAGDIIPADLRIIESKDLFITQASLTGESEPVEKFSNVENIDKKETNPLYLKNICFMGTNVISGTATAIVLFTGKNTYFGSMSKLITVKKAKTNFDKGIEKLSLFLINLMIIIVLLIFIINSINKHDWFSAFLFAISVAVGLTPEMLPVIISVNLTKGAISMSKKRTIVKNINSIQNFGSMDVLCSDKTGTLTENIVILQYHMNIHGKEDLRILKYAYLNSNFQTGLKNLMDIAIINKALENGFYNLNLNYKKIDEIPFDFVRRRMSVILENKNNNNVQIITKGATEEMLKICKYVEYNDSIVELTDDIKEEIMSTVLDLNNDGMRVLALAKKNIDKGEEITIKAENNMILMGYLSFLDPVKQSAKSAIKALKNNNVKVKVLTGDSEIITKYVCKQVGIENKKILLGTDIDIMDDDELQKKIDNIDIFAKLSPQQKLRIVQILKRRGHVVGFMGDGINDAPAMREADVAISVDSAVDIAKESADVILLKKDLNVLNDGVIEGRKIFCNIIKYIKMTISSNFGNIFSLLFASIFIPFLPMLPIQILILNILYDLSQISIPWDNVDNELLIKQKKWSNDSIKRFMVFVGSISTLCDLLLFFFMYKILNYDALLFSSSWFIASIFTQIVIIHFIRTDKKPFIQSSASMNVTFSTIIILIISIILPYVKIGKYLGFVPVQLNLYLILIFILFIYIFLINFVKNNYIKKYKEWL